MKRIIAAAAALTAALLFPMKAEAISAGRALVLDGLSGRVLFEKDPDTRSLIASTTKIMTALVVCEQCNVLDRMRIPKEAVGIEGSSMYLKEGEVLTIQELLYGLMLSSGNDAAVALAIYCGGTVEGFAELMNDRAAGLGLRNTHFENPNGLDSPGHYSTARDLAILSAYAMENPVFARTVSTKNVKIGDRFLHNHNKLLWRMEGAEGIKTGYTRAAGRILVSSARRQGRRVIAVTLNDPDDWNDHISLMNRAFSDYTVREIVRKGQKITTLEVAGGEHDEVPVYAGASFSYALTPEETPMLVLPGPGFVYPSVEAGAEAGTAYVMLGSRVIGKIPAFYGETVEEKENSSWIQRLFGGNRHGAITENSFRQGRGVPAEGRADD